METFEPAGEKDKETAGQLWGLIFFQFGGVGGDELHRQAPLRTALMERFAAWEPRLSDTYDPGWQSAIRPTEAKYARAVALMKQHRRAQLETFAKLIMDDRYYAASRELTEIQRRSPRGIITGSADGARSKELQAIMRDVAREIVPGTPPAERP